MAYQNTLITFPAQRAKRPTPPIRQFLHNILPKMSLLPVSIKSIFRFVKHNGKEYEAVYFFQGMQVLANKIGLQGHLHIFFISSYFLPPCPTLKKANCLNVLLRSTHSPLRCFNEFSWYGSFIIKCIFIRL